MQGVILSARTDQGLILGDDGNRYTFDPSEWRSDGAAPEVGVRVEFEVRGSDAADIYPIPGMALAVGGAFVVLDILGAVALWVLGSSGPPTGKEIARHSHEDRVYVLVEYGDELAVFSDSGPPVTQQELAEDIVHSYAWRLVLDDFDTGQLTDISPRVAVLNDYTFGERDFSNDVVAIFDKLESLGANVPFRGRVSAMDAVKEAYPSVGVAEILIRSLDSELNALSDNAVALTRASTRIPRVEPSSVRATRWARCSVKRRRRRVTWRAQCGP